MTQESLAMVAKLLCKFLLQIPEGQTDIDTINPCEVFGGNYEETVARFVEG